MDFEVRNPGEELPYVWNNFINDKCFFLVDFVSGKSAPKEGFNTITNKGGKSQKPHYRKFNRTAHEATQKKRKERHTVVLSRNQRKERKKQVHRQQRSKVAKLRSKIWSSYKYAVHLQHNRHLKPSVEVQPHWKTTHQFNYTELGKLNLSPDRVEETILSRKGILRKFNPLFDNVTATSPAELKRELLGQTLFVHPRAVRDQTLINYSKGEGNVFATGRVLAVLMSCVRAVHSFDIPLRKKDGVIFLDHTSSSRVMDYSVNETSRNNPSVADKDRRRLNSAFSLKRERTLLNKIFGEQILLPRDQHIRLKEPSPFQLKEGTKKKMSEKGYIYKRIQLNSKINVVVRCEVDGIVGDHIDHTAAVKTGKGSRVTKKKFYPYMINRAVHEFQYAKEGRWETLLETRPGTVIVRELQNNSFEFGRWIFEGLLSDAQHFQVGFITRKNMNSEKSHQLLKVERYDTESIAEQFHVNLGNGYAILEKILSSIMGCEDGDYVLLKIPNKQCVNCYRISDKEKDEN